MSNAPRDRGTPLRDRGAALRRWDRVHTWSSLACTVFLLLQCLTGLPLVFHDEIDAALAAPAAPATPGPPLSVDRLVQHALQREPGRFVQFVFWDEEMPRTLGVGLADTPDAALEDVRRVVLDAATGAPLPARVPAGGVMATLLELHKSLLIGLPGELVLALVALAFLASLVSGVVLYRPFLRERAFGAVRSDGPPRHRWLDLHNAHGIVLLAWLTVVGATGLMNALEAPLFDAWQAEAMPRLLDPYRDKPYPARLSPAQGALDAARAALPGMRPTSIGYPYSRFGSPRHYLVWMKGDTPLTERFFTPVLVDAETGALASAAPLPWYLRLLEISRPLHFGDYGGLPLKLLWAALDLLTIGLLASGLHVWLSKRQNARPTPS